MKDRDPVRGFLKHKVYGSVYAVEFDLAGDVLAALPVVEATACRHMLAGYPLRLDDIEEMNAHLRDYAHFSPICSDPAHLLAEIGEQDRRCRAAEGAWSIAHNHAKALKETYAQEEATLRALVRATTNPPPRLPLFDEKPDDDDAPAAPADQPSA